MNPSGQPVSAISEADSIRTRNLQLASVGFRQKPVGDAGRWGAEPNAWRWLHVDPEVVWSPVLPIYTFRYQWWRVSCPLQWLRPSFIPFMSVGPHSTPWRRSTAGCKPSPLKFSVHPSVRSSLYCRLVHVVFKIAAPLWVLLFKNCWHSVSASNASDLTARVSCADVAYWRSIHSHVIVKAWRRLPKYFR